MLDPIHNTLLVLRSLTIFREGMTIAQIAEAEAVVEAAQSTILEWLLFALAIFMGSSLAGLAQILFEGKEIPRKRALGAFLLSGFAGCIVCLLLYSRLKEDLALLTGISLLAGVGGASTLDFLSGLAYRIVRMRLNVTEKKNANRDQEDG